MKNYANYNFDEIITRENTASVKYDLRQLIFKKDDVIPMWVADMDFKTPDFVIDAIGERLKHEVLGYSIRPESYFQAQINWLNRRFGWKTEKDWFLFSPGVVPGFTLAILAFTNPGDEVIVQPPVYFPFFSAVKDNGRELVYNQLKEENGTYSFDFDDLKRKITPKTKALLLSSPHNPVGRVWKKEELEELAAICLENDILILSDEIHGDLILKPYSQIPMATLSPEIAEKTVTFIAPSKTFNLAGLATSSVIISNPELRKKFQKVVDSLHIGMGNVFGNVGAEAAYTFGDHWLDELLDYLKANYEFLKEYILTNIPKINVSPLEATYLVWLDFRKYKQTGKELNELLIQKAGIGLNEGSTFGPGGEGFMRINIACPRAILAKALDQLKKALID